MTDLLIYPICCIAVALLYFDARELLVAWYSDSESGWKTGLFRLLAQMVINITVIVLALTV